MDKRLIIGLICLFGVCLLSAQDRKSEPDKKKKRVDLLYADEAQADKQLRPDVQVLIGSVRMKHDSMYMFCDSALIYEKINSVEAFGNVRMEQGDTLFIYGDYLYYDGMSQLAMLRENVRMINRNTELTTDSLNYDRIYNLGYYFDGGTLTDEENVLTSEWGRVQSGNQTGGVQPWGETGKSQICPYFRHAEIQYGVQNSHYSGAFRYCQR